MSTPVASEAYAKSVRDEIRRKVKEKMGGPSVSSPEPMTPEATHAAPKKKAGLSYFFSADDASLPAPEGKVRLSSLIPSWDTAKGTLDPWVTVHDRVQYTDDAAAMIPAVDPVYLPNQESIALLAHALEYTDVPSWLTGPPSVGKTSVVRYLCAITNRPFYRINFNGHTATEDVLGSLDLRPSPDGSGTVTEWHDGIIPTAMRTPNAVMLLDEPSAGTAEVQMVLQATLERGGYLMLTSKPGSVADRTVKPAPGMRWVMADNTTGQGDMSGRFVGTSPQNAAWLDRVGTFVTVNWLHAADESKMLQAMYPEVTSTLTDKVVTVAGLLRQAMEQGTVNTVMSMRVTQAWCQHAAVLRDVKQAFVISYVNRIDDPAERDAVMEVYRNVFGS